MRYVNEEKPVALAVLPCLIFVDERNPYLA